MPFLVYASRRKQARWGERSDRQVMEAIQRGDEGALDELIRRKAASLVQVVARITRDREEAKDIVQVVFLRVWEKRHDYDPRWSPSTWMYRIGVHLAIDLVRSRQAQQQAIAPLGAHLRSVRTERSRSVADLQQREVAKIFEELSEVLTERQRWVFLLAGVEGLTSDEVGQILGCSASTVRNHLFAARKRLRVELERRYPEYAPTVDHAPEPDR